MEKIQTIIPVKMTRRSWGYVLFLGAAISLMAAFALDRLGLKSQHLSPLSFIGAVVFLKLGLFGFWPTVARRFKENALVVPAPAAPRAVAKTLHRLDPRVDGSVFAHNVPTFVLNHEQRFVEWNAAFALVFGAAGLTRGAPVTAWFELLDNFKRVSKRQEKLFGEGILPITDRERATYVSPVFGRMVFTKIMSPVVDRRTGRILGWNVVLNINSVTKREEFFERLYAVLAKETRKVRYAAALDGVMKAYPAYKELMAAHLAAVGSGEARRILEVGVGAGLLTRRLVRNGHRVTAVDGETEILRKVNDRCGAAAGLKLVRQAPDAVHSLPAARFDAASLTLSAHRVSDLGALLSHVFAALKPGAHLALSSLAEGATVPALFAHIRQTLEAAGAYEELKHQLSHVEDYERELAEDGPFVPRSPAGLKGVVEAAGFVVESCEDGRLGGAAVFLVARKP